MTTANAIERSMSPPQRTSRRRLVFDVDGLSSTCRLHGVTRRRHRPIRRLRRSRTKRTGFAVHGGLVLQTAATYPITKRRALDLQKFRRARLVAAAHLQRPANEIALQLANAFVKRDGSDR